MMIVRPAGVGDVDGMYRLAAAAGNGLTNLPPNREALASRIEDSVATLAGEIDDPGSQQVRLVLEAEGVVVGVAAIWPRVGQGRPFYSYQISELSHISRSTDRRVQHRMLTLVSSMSGASEVGGLLLDPSMRGTSAGRLLARSRYMFIALHRDMFADRVFAELRGYQDTNGKSPFWEAVGRHFYDMEFEEADLLSGIPDHPIIEELSPKFPIYVNMLPHEAREAINRPHDDGRAALAMLRAEGFSFGDFVDIFDAGPTTVCETGRIATIANVMPLRTCAGHGTTGYLVGCGSRRDFRCIIANGTVSGDQLVVDSAFMDAMGAAPGQQSIAVAL